MGIRINMPQIFLNFAMCIRSWVMLLGSQSWVLIILFIDLGKAYYLLQAVSTKFSLTIKLTSFVLFWNAEHLHPKDSYPELICQWTDPLQPLSLGAVKGGREVICLPETYSAWASHTHSMSHSLPPDIKQNRSRCLTALLHIWSHNFSLIKSVWLSVMIHLMARPFPWLPGSWLSLS